MKKLAFIDLETTGFDLNRHEVIQIGCVLADQSSGELKVLDEVDIKIQPENIEEADAQALRINHYDPADWLFAYTLKEGMQLLGQKTEGAVMVAHNICFDRAFLDRAFEKSGIENKMHRHKLDTISIAYAKLWSKGIDKFSLKFLCEYFGVNNQKAHSALSDAKATMEVYQKLMQE